MYCPVCDRKMKCRKGDHHYTECGLDGVYLVDVEICTCGACGETVVGIPRAAELHGIIGMELVKKPARLSGREIRFLRKSLGQSSRSMAKALGVTHETLSRWENGERMINDPSDRLLRLIYANLKGVPMPNLLEDFAGIDSKSAEPSRINLPGRLFSKDRGDCRLGNAA